MTGLDRPATGALPRGPLLGFAAGSLGMGVWVTVPGLLLLYFLTDVLAVSPWLAGLTLLLPKVADVLLHPWVGHRCDVEQARRGDRRRLLLAGCALPVAFAALFAVPGGATGVAAAGWVALCFVAGNLLFAAYQVPYLATPADLRIGYHERTRLMAFRMVVLTLGILVAGLLVAAADRQGHRHPRRLPADGGGAVLGMALAAMLVGVTGIARLRGAAPATVTPHATGGWQALTASLRDRQFRRLVAAYLAMSTTTHLVLAGVPYYAQYELGRAEAHHRAGGRVRLPGAAGHARLAGGGPPGRQAAGPADRPGRLRRRRAGAGARPSPPAWSCWWRRWRCSGWRSPACSCCRSRCCPT
ncbi:MFS transporter [Micromonospora sp. R77]|uniref:MFS transporter n=1 Tax=Micromonospora sp. R77 TaxID=2925836 RepID=UPI001F619913|nr:MFS transporter [Micromonospora sp. R77]MCI4066670.1 MFS transporter [Micromonospora sp. R77]